MPDPRLDDLISLYFRLRAAGTPADPADLARPCPELLPNLLRHLDVLGRLRDPDRSASATMPHVPPLAAAPASPPGYEILGELGRGGMGVVYKARQTAANRVVALKMILSGSRAGAELLARFQGEIEIVAALSHPAVVQIFEVGRFEGCPYYSFELCANSLDRRLAGTPMPGRDAAALARTLADALRAVHAAGVVHRDLKPANVLLTDAGQPKITDFGLAKRADTFGDTPSGAALGTPGYMAPEQVGGSRSVGPPADLYALGAILYECLTGRAPFKGETTADTLLQVVHEDPVPPHRLNPRVPADLETICLKCLQKAPARRYPDAAALADDLGRFLDGKPILARPVSLFERGWKSVRRHPAVSSLAALVTALTVGSLVVISVLYANAVEYARRADELAKQAAADRDRAELRARTSYYAYLLDQARDRIDAGRHEQARQLLEECPADLRSWEHDHLLLRLVEGYASRSEHPDEAAESLALDRDGRLLAAGSSDGSVHLWEPAASRLVGTVKVGPDPVKAVALSPDGRHLVAVAWPASAALPSAESPGTARIYEVPGGRPLPRGDLGKLVTAVAFSPDGAHLAVGEADGQFRLVPFPALGPGWERTAPGPVAAFAFHPRGRRLAVAAGPAVFLLRSSDGQPELPPVGHDGDVRGLAYSADGRYLACIDGGLNKVVVWEQGARPTAAHRLGDGQREILAVAFDRSGPRPLLVYGHARDGFHAFDLRDRRAFPPRAAANSAARAAAFLPGGLLAGAAKAGVELFDPRQAGAGRSLVPPPTPGAVLLARHRRRPASHVAFDGYEVETAERGDRTEVSARQSGLTLARFPAAGRVVGPEGEFAAEAASADPTVIHLTDARTGKHRDTLRGHRSPVLRLAFGPDARRLYSAATGEIKVWCPHTGIELLSLKTDKPTPPLHLGFDEEAACLVCVGDRTDLFAAATTGSDAVYAGFLWLLRAEEANEWADALTLIDELEKVYPASPALERRRLRALCRLGREEGFVAGLVAATRRRPDADLLAWWLTHDQDLGPDPDETLPLVEDALARSPESWPLRALRGWMRRQSGREGAEDDLSAAARQAGDRPDLLALAAGAELDRGQPDHAAALLEGLRRDYPASLAAWHEARAASAAPERAAWHLARMLDDAPDDDDLRARLGLALMRAGRFAEAAGHLGRAADAGHGTLTRCLQGEALLAAGDAAGYRRVCASVVRKRPREEEIPAVVRLCLLGPEALGDPGQLIRLIEVPRRPPDPQPDLDADAIEVEAASEPAFPVLIAAALIRAGRPLAAVRQLDRAGLRGDRSAARLLAIAYRRAGRHDAAARVEGLYFPGAATVPRLGPLAGPLALHAELLPHLPWDDWRTLLPPPPAAELLLSTR